MYNRLFFYENYIREKFVRGFRKVLEVSFCVSMLGVEETFFVKNLIFEFDLCIVEEFKFILFVYCRNLGMRKKKKYKIWFINSKIIVVFFFIKKKFIVVFIVL